MVQYIILLKSKGSKRWSGAILAKPNVAYMELVRVIRSQTPSNLSYKIVTSSQFDKLMIKKPRKKPTRRVSRLKKRKRINTVRKKTRRQKANKPKIKRKTVKLQPKTNQNYKKRWNNSQKFASKVDKIDF